MIVLSRPLDCGFDGAFVSDSPLSWIARDGSKPERRFPDAWVLHGNPEWSSEHLELEPAVALAALLTAFESAVAVELPEPSYAAAHRWRYALPQTPLEERCLLDEQRGLAACGDWCGGPRVEGAFLSGAKLAERLVTGT